MCGYTLSGFRKKKKQRGIIVAERDSCGKEKVIKQINIKKSHIPSRSSIEN